MIKFIKFIDKYIIILFLYLLYPLKKIKNRENRGNIENRDKNNKKILIIKLWAIGESILTIPAIKRLFEKGYKIDVLCTSNNKSVYEGIEYINKIKIFNYKNIFKLLNVIFELRKNRYNIIYDFEPFMNISVLLGAILKKKIFIGFNTGKRKFIYDKKLLYNDKIHCSAVYFNLIKEKNYPTKLVKLKYELKDKLEVEKKLEKYNINNKILIGFHIGSAPTGLGRRWNEENFAELFNRIKAEYNNVEIIFTGTNYEAELFSKIEKNLKGNYINLINELTIKQLFYLLERINIYIANDTGPMHISAAMGTDTIGLFGANLPDRFRPLGDNNISLYHKVECSPCINVHLGEVKECINNYKCMKLITVNELFREIKHKIKEK
ncbi:glycosyltransferase family 9 protein [Haliovirga abyssi]|uniref:LPS biosynthesis protein n=1 Tax=Haliovirga abyssi TaxID=2996794 RepID=A0AAU9DV08_9FUSO|nr:glycosyltransferase family 9 protein [Haliovirga abyssi]BDU51129.1 LPS biosynthesis protein [Haliovirga abyssi]